MHDIWSPWHGCVKCSEGCDHCYMYFLDKIHGNKDGSRIYKTSFFRYPLQKRQEWKLQNPKRRANSCLYVIGFLSGRS